MEKIYNYVKTTFMGHDIYTIPMKVSDLLPIYYVAARGVSQEPGAVQRILNKSRISQIRDFILAGNSFVSSFILNWTDQEHLPIIGETSMTIDLFESQAQILVPTSAPSSIWLWIVCASSSWRARRFALAIWVTSQFRSQARVQRLPTSSPLRTSLA